MPGNGLGDGPGQDESVTRLVSPSQDGRLEGEWMLRGCSMLEHDGRRWPSLGRIALVARLGQGGMGVVYRGVNPRLGTEVAVKILPPSLGQMKGEFAERFVREARIAARLRSEHLVTVSDVDRDEPTGCHFLVMELVKGSTAVQWLHDVVAGGRQGVRESDALDVCIAASKGLAAAHVEGIVHRDVKPGNVLIPADADGRPQLARAKLSDLGLARGDAGEASLTGTQIALGTPGYMAPEQAEDAHRAGKPADVFSMGATLYAFLAGVAPFRGSTPVEAIVKTVKGEFRPLHEVRADVSAATAAVVGRCLARDAADRFPDAPALLQALEICRGALGAGSTGAADAAARIAALGDVEETGKPLDGVPSAAARGPAATTQTAVPGPRTPVASQTPTSSTTAIAPPSSRTLVLPSAKASPGMSRRGTLVAAGVAVIALGAVAAVAVPMWRAKPAKPPRAAPGATNVRQRTAGEHAAHQTGAAPADPAPTGASVASDRPADGDPSTTHNSADPAAVAVAPPPASGSPSERSGAADTQPGGRRLPKLVSGPKPAAEADTPSGPGAGDPSRPPPRSSSAPASVPAEPKDPVEAAQQFDLGGLPGREDSFTEQQLRKFAAAHRRGDLAAAAELQRKLHQFYLRFGDTVRARVARDRAEVLDREIADRTSAQAPANESKNPAGAPPEGTPPPPPPPPPGGGQRGPGPNGPPPPPPPPRR